MGANDNDSNVQLRLGQENSARKSIAAQIVYKGLQLTTCGWSASIITRSRHKYLQVPFHVFSNKTLDVISTDSLEIRHKLLHVLFQVDQSACWNIVLLDAEVLHNSVRGIVISVYLYKQNLEREVGSGKIGGNLFKTKKKSQ